MTDHLMEGGAQLSPCGRYRHFLWRRWDAERPALAFIMLNPSTADADVDDATIRVCIGRAQRMGFGCIHVANLFPMRATDPRALTATRPSGRLGMDADYYLELACSTARMIIAAWGALGTISGYRRARCEEALELLVGDRGHTLHALRITKDGHPAHPLRIPYAEQPQAWMTPERWRERRAA